MTAIRLVAAAACVLWATGAAAQTHTEMLEKGIFTEDTAGNLAEALRIYEGILRAPGAPEGIAARAQARATDLRRRLDTRARMAAAPAPDRAPAFPVARVANRPAAAPAQAGGGGGAAAPCCAENYDPARAVTVSGTITRLEWVNPQGVVYVQGDDGNLWGFTVMSPNTLLRSGWNRNDPRPGEQVLVYAYLAKGTDAACPATLPNACATLPGGALHASASTIARDGTMIFDRAVLEQNEQRLRDDPEYAKAVWEAMQRAMEESRKR
jgi:hypothetical protein